MYKSLLVLFCVVFALLYTAPSFCFTLYHIFVSEVVVCWLVMLRFVYTQLCVCVYDYTQITTIRNCAWLWIGDGSSAYQFNEQTLVH